MTSEQVVEMSVTNKFSELLSRGRSHYTNYWYSWVQTIYFIKKACFFLPESLLLQLFVVVDVLLLKEKKNER